MHFSLILFGSIKYVKVSMLILSLGTIAHYELCTTVAFIAVFLADIMPQIHDIRFVCFCFGRKLNRADSKNSFMTVTRTHKPVYCNYVNFWISKDIVCASGFKTHYVYA
jgi:hypothetical protein